MGQNRFVTQQRRLAMFNIRNRLKVIVWYCYVLIMITVDYKNYENTHVEEPLQLIWFSNNILENLSLAQWLRERHSA